MKLSLYTISQFLSNCGINVSEYIDEGFSEIHGFSLYDGSPAKKGIIEIKESTISSDAFILSNKGDYIIADNTTITQIINTLSKTFLHYNTWHESLLSALAEDASLQKLLEITHPLFERPMFIKGDSSWVYAITFGYESDVHPDWSQLEDSFTVKRAIFSSVQKVSMDPVFQSVFKQRTPIKTNSPFTGSPVLRTNVFIDDARICEIVILENGLPFTQSDLYILSSFAEIVKKHIINNKEVFFNHQGLSVFFMNLLSGQEQSISSLKLARKMSRWDEKDNLAVFILQPLHPKETPLTGVMRDTLVDNLSGCTVFIFEEKITCIINVTLNGGYNTLCNKLKKIIPKYAFRWGMSYMFHFFSDLLIYHAQALEALEFATSDNVFFRTMYQISFRALVNKLDFDPTLRDYIHPDIVSLKKYDSENGTDLYNTLYAFLLCGKNYTDTAHLLKIHRNTVIYRMNLIQSLFSFDIDNIEVVKLLLMSMFMNEKN